MGEGEVMGGASCFVGGGAGESWPSDVPRPGLVILGCRDVGGGMIPDGTGNATGDVSR